MSTKKIPTLDTSRYVWEEDPIARKIRWMLYPESRPNGPRLGDDIVVHKVIEEREVAAHLEKGFIFKHQLHNGSVIVETTISAAKIEALADENIRKFADTQIEAATLQLTKQALTKIDAAASSQDPIPPAQRTI
jgi:hypothetical protein